MQARKRRRGWASRCRWCAGAATSALFGRCATGFPRGRNRARCWVAHGRRAVARRGGPHRGRRRQEGGGFRRAARDGHAEHAPAFGAAVDEFVGRCAREKGLRGSTLHGYKAIAERLAGRPWRRDSTWADRVLDTFTDHDLLVVRLELVEAGRCAETVNHYRRVVRGIFGTHRSVAALAWSGWPDKAESEGKLRFYTPEQVERLIAQAYADMDAAIYTLATEAGPRLSEIRAFKVENADFEAGPALRGRVHHARWACRQQGPAGALGADERERQRACSVPFCEGKSGEVLVFQHDSRPGEPICGIEPLPAVHQRGERAGLPQLRLHDLRHAFGTQAIRVFGYLRGAADDGPPPHHDDRALPALRARPRRRGEADRRCGEHAERQVRRLRHRAAPRLAPEGGEGSWVRTLWGVVRVDGVGVLAAAFVRPVSPPKMPVLQVFRTEATTGIEPV